jgi:hypothetical protein
MSARAEYFVAPGSPPYTGHSVLACAARRSDVASRRMAGREDFISSHQSPAAGRRGLGVESEPSGGTSYSGEGRVKVVRT